MADERFFRRVVNLAHIIRPQLGTGNIDCIIEKVFVNILPHDLDSPEAQIAFQFFDISVLSQGNIPDRSDIDRFTAFSTLVALSGSLQHSLTFLLAFSFLTFDVFHCH
jgi:hypothetical protein